jgi:MFS family permease
VYLAYNLAFVFVAIPLGKLADRVGERKVISIGFLAAACAYFGLAGSYDPLSLIAFFILLGFYSAATDGLQRALAAKAVPAELLATGQGFLNMAIGFSSLGAGILGGLLWTNYSSSAALIYAGVFSLIGLALFLVMTSRYTFRGSHV